VCAIHQLISDNSKAINIGLEMNKNRELYDNLFVVTMQILTENFRSNKGYEVWSNKGRERNTTASEKQMRELFGREL
jgi:hypothetical protein